jgi:hypothetical protein
VALGIDFTVDDDDECILHVGVYLMSTSSEHRPNWVIADLNKLGRRR